MTILNIDSAFELESHVAWTAHGYSAMEVLRRAQKSGEPLLFSAKYPIQVGDSITFNRLNVSGAVVRLVDRDEFLAWEQRMFPGSPSVIREDDRWFIEVAVD